MFDLILIGFGNVGQRLVRLLEELGPALAREHGVSTRVIGIVTRSRGHVFDKAGLNAQQASAHFRSRVPGRAARGTTLTFLEDALKRSRTAAQDGRLIVVELTTLDTGTGQPAVDHVRAALRGRAHVVTANKAPAAFAYRELAAEAQRAGRHFLFESSVLDGVPVFNLVRAALPAVAVTGFRGVINSTTNYILTSMERGESFADALAAMQRAGIAEADASLDVDGWDAAAKTAVLANVLLNGDLTPHTVDREGLSHATADRVNAARNVGKRVKLVASAERTQGIVRGRVRLVELPETDLLAQLEGQQNALVLQTDLLEEIAVVQRGGGLTQTAYGLVSDIVAIAREVKGTPSRQRQPRAARRGRSPSPPARRQS